MTARAVACRAAVAVLTLMLTGAGPIRAQVSTVSSPDTSDRIGPVLEALESDQRVRLYVEGADPMEATLVEASADSVYVREDVGRSRVAASRIERLDVATHPYRTAAGIGAAAGAVVGGVIGGLSGGDGESDRTNRPVPESSPNQLAPLAGVTVGVLGGTLVGGGVGALVAVGITDWEQRYPPPE